MTRFEAEVERREGREDPRDERRRTSGRKEKELQEQLFRLRFQKSIGQLDNALKLRETRRDIARVKTDPASEKQAAPAGPEVRAWQTARRSTSEEGRRRNEQVGVVVSAKMQKTVVVAVERLVRHDVYRKTIKRTSTFMAHDEKGAKKGDTVRIVETRPLSKHKRWRVVEIVGKAAVTDDDARPGA